jgi:hypothetical protein
MAAVPLGSRDPEVETGPGIAARRESGKVNMRRTEKGQPRRMVDYDTTITLPFVGGLVGVSHSLAFHRRDAPKAKGNSAGS